MLTQYEELGFCEKGDRDCMGRPMDMKMVFGLDTRFKVSEAMAALLYRVPGVVHCYHIHQYRVQVGVATMYDHNVVAVQCRKALEVMHNRRRPGKKVL